MPPPSRVASARRAADALVADVLALAASVAQIPAPTGAEHERARAVRDWLHARGFAPDLDDLGDVTARLPGRDAGRAVAVAAHTDTVFPAGTSLAVRAEPGRLAGPGIGDNSLGVAALCHLPAILAAMGETPAADVLLAATVGEEGLGNLRGIRAVMDAHPDLAAVVALEGQTLGRVTHVAVGSRRLRVTLSGPGGHSWGDAGRPSAIHAMADLIAELDTLPLPEHPKTTLNVGVVEGGTSVNTIAARASFVLDLRSTDAAALAHLSDAVERAARRANRGAIRADVEVLGERPAGAVPADAPLVRVATGALAALGVAPICDASSTDANVPIGRGVPAICVGLTYGGNVHRVDEYIETEPVAVGLAALALLVLGAAEAVADGRLAPRALVAR